MAGQRTEPGQPGAHSDEIRRNVQLNREIIAAFNSGGMADTASFFDPEVVVHDPDLPGGELRGRDTVIATFSEMTTGFDSMQVRRIDMYPAGDRIVSLIHSAGSGEGIRGAMEVEFRTAHVTTFAGGKVVDWQVFDNARSAFESAGLDPEAPGEPFPEAG
ncbi:MAG: nuclear transport factor 2 family protein [Solirubrobacterales bacterium]|nr:nuclear transport factor 2 family protein [Solirubrobacterales bacterium]